MNVLTIRAIKSLEGNKAKLKKNQLIVFQEVQEPFAKNLKNILISKQSFFNTKPNNELIKGNLEKIDTTISINDAKSIIKNILDNYQPKNNLLHQCAHFIFKLRNGRDFTREDTDTYKKVQEFSMRYGLAASAA